MKERAAFLYAIAEEINAISPDLLPVAQRETHLDEARLKVELKRTVFQLTSYADACAEGTWLHIRIDTADKDRNPPKPDLRKMLVPSWAGCCFWCVQLSICLFHGGRRYGMCAGRRL